MLKSLKVKFLPFAECVFQPNLQSLVEIVVVPSNASSKYNERVDPTLVTLTIEDEV